MANSEMAKIKLLLIYDFFMKKVSAYDSSSDVTVGGIIDYLKTLTGETFERKSIYNDIKRINEFMVRVGQVEPGKEFIYMSGGKTYSRMELKSELSLDEARLIVDAVSTTPFVKTGLCEKIKKEHPTYFRDGYVPLHSHDEKADRNMNYLLNTIRNCIEEKTVFSFGYGYAFAGGIKGASVKKCSPLALDWKNDRYYLIAVDNEAYAESGDLEDSLRHYRVDRIEKKNYMPLTSEKFADPGEKRKAILDKFVKTSVDAYSTKDTKIIRMKLTAREEKTLLRAYAAFADAVGELHILRDKSSSGCVEFCFESGLTPTLFTHIFMLHTFDGITVDIANDDVRDRYTEYLQKALKG